MRARMISTGLLKDEWYRSLPQEERLFFLHLLITQNGEMSGIFKYIDSEIIFDNPSISPEKLSVMKKKFESDNKVFFFEGWVWLKNFTKSNFFQSPQQQEGIFSQLRWVKNNCPEVIEHFQKKGFTMPDLQDFMIQKQRNKVKKELRRVKPYLFGAQLENEVDKVIGVVHTGKMDWAAVVNAVKAETESKYPTPESIKYENVVAVAEEFGIRPYHLFWFYSQKLEKLQANGRNKFDYMATLRAVAGSILKKKDLEPEEKIVAVQLYAKKLRNITITRQKAETMIFLGEI